MEQRVCEIVICFPAGVGSYIGDEQIFCKYKSNVCCCTLVSFVFVERSCKKLCLIWYGLEKVLNMYVCTQINKT